MGEGPTKIEAGELIMKFFDRFSLDDEGVGKPSGSFTLEPSVLLSATQDLGTVTPPTGPATGMPTGTAVSGTESATVTTTIEPSISMSQSSSFAAANRDLSLARNVLGGLTVMYTILEFLRY